MNTKHKWMVYGATGLVGLGVFAGGAAAVANAMELRTTEGTVISEGAITDEVPVAADRAEQEQVVDPKLTVVSAPSAASPASAVSAHSTQSAESPVSTPSPASPASVDSPNSPNSPASPASAASADSR